MHFFRSWLTVCWRRIFKIGFGGLVPVGDAVMSRRRVSVKELGQVDYQGWLYRKKEGKGFLGTKWKKYWFVLKKNSLYWYPAKMAEKAEGYVNLADFTVNQATECKKKHALKASHPNVVTLYFAAENLWEMNIWLSKLSMVEVTDTPSKLSVKNYGECYSEASDQEEVETLETSCPLYSEQLTTDSINGDVPPPRSASSPCHCPVSAPASIMTSETMDSSWLNVCSPEKAGRQSPSLLHLSQEEEDGLGSKAREGTQEVKSDEMEALYLHLKQVKLSPTGELKRDYRTSFIHRCKDNKVNEKLHLARTLNSTLKAKEADLFAIEQVLFDPMLTAERYRDWKVGNILLLQEIQQCNKAPPGGSRVPSFLFKAPQIPVTAETSM
ncbi:interactor protein for cytohesin exchange factors 1 isoform X4 [Esox lucius]|uniref:interactor protein for cytohesin exchange factors 1 isoform X4 n=1 Tax=Esox lucius TaxID=8010 RepID=UPI000576DF9F|nr:interactor protein for cytohesin exchange factors 1 isoform X4 [Esox lucius]